MTTKNDMTYGEIEELMDRFLKCNLHFLDRIEWSQKFMDGEASKEEIELLIN